MIWSYGITTVPARKVDLFPRTLASLALAGFDTPRIFVDGASSGYGSGYGHPFLEITYRNPVIKTVANWHLALLELYIRSPRADRYALFQDDIVLYKNLRQYLDQSPYPIKGYLNLFTFPRNQDRAPANHIGWFESDQTGLGAVALIFDNLTARILLGSMHLINKHQDQQRGTYALDGGVIDSLKERGWKEYCHSPSLVNHVATSTTMNYHPNHPQTFAQAYSFRGEQFDALELLKESKNTICGNMPNFYIGTWKIMTPTGLVSTRFHLFPDFRAVKDHDPSCQGSWEIVDEQARITWADGWRDLIKLNNQQTFKTDYAPNTEPWTQVPTMDFAIKESHIP